MGGGGREPVFLKGEIRHKDLWVVDLATGVERQLTKLAADFGCERLRCVGGWARGGSGAGARAVGCGDDGSWCGLDLREFWVEKVGVVGGAFLLGFLRFLGLQVVVNCGGVVVIRVV